jgi:heme-degrading monooxygenase HmoA
VAPDWRTLPGFVEGFAYESTDGGSCYNVVTTAVWKDEDAYQNAKKSAAEEFQRIGFNPPEIMKKLNAENREGSLSALPVLSTGE